MAQIQAASAPEGAKRANSLGLTKAALATLLDKLDAMTANELTARRALARLPFRHDSIALNIIHADKSEASTRVVSRNLSRGGIGVLHSAFIHPGSGCRIEIPTAAGSVRTVSGKVARCIHRGGVLHELGIKFDRHIDLRQFVRSDPFNTILSFEKVKPESLTGNVVLCSQVAFDEQLFMHNVRETPLKITVARTPDDAIARIHEACDVLVIDTAATGEFAAAVVAKTAEAGVFVPILILTDDRGPQIRKQLSEVNASIVLTKPVQQMTLWRALAEIAAVRADTAAAKPAAVA